MNNLIESSVDFHEDPLIPQWLAHALQEAEVEPEEFRAQCLRSADIAFTMAQMRHANQHLGESIGAVPSFLRALATIAQLPLDPVLSWVGLRLDRPADAVFAVAWGRLAQALHLGVREALLRLRLTFAEEVGLESVPALARLRASGNASSVFVFCEEFLDRESALWDAEVQARLHASEQELLKMYQPEPSAAEEV